MNEISQTDFLQGELDTAQLVIKDLENQLVESEHWRIAQLKLYQKALKEAKVALDKLAAWGEGPVVKPSFDSPWCASVARDALSTINSVLGESK